MRWLAAVGLGLVGWVVYRAARSGFAPASDSHSDNGDGPSHWDLAPAAAPVPLHLVRWTVRVPPSTPANDTVYLCGGHSIVGDWSPRGLPLLPVEPGVYRGAVQIRSGTSFEYKFTRGSWDRVETCLDGGERTNRVFVAAAPETVHAEVEAWSDIP